VRKLWEGAAGPLGLDARFVEDAVARAGGNVQHAVQLRRQVAAAPAHLRRARDIPRGLDALIEQTWERIARNAVVVEGLGILCAARAALTLDELGAVAASIGDLTPRAFLQDAKEVLAETQRPDGQREYRLHHDASARTSRRRSGTRRSAAITARWPSGCNLAGSRASGPAAVRLAQRAHSSRGGR
jgi:hypothetical protein